MLPKSDESGYKCIALTNYDKFEENAEQCNQVISVCSESSESEPLWIYELPERTLALQIEFMYTPEVVKCLASNLLC